MIAAMVRSRRALTVGFAGLVLAASVAGPAAAATVTGDDTGGQSALRLVAAPGEANVFAISRVDVGDTTTTWSVADAGGALEAGAGCAVDQGEVRCTLVKSRPPSNCIRGFCLTPGRSAAIIVDAGDGDDTLDLSGVPPSDGGGGLLSVDPAAGPGADVIIAGPGNGAIDPGPGADTVDAGTGNDRVLARTGGPDGADVIDLGAGGFDSVTYRGADGPVTVSANGIADDGAPGEGDAISGAESIEGGPGDDVLVADGIAGEAPATFARTLIGGGGNDVLVGGPANDFISGGVPSDGGSDTVDAGGGDDFILTGGGADTLAGGGGADELDAGAGDDRLRGQAGGDELDGEAGSDRLAGGGGGDLVAGGGSPDLVAGGSGPDRLYGGGGGDSLAARGGGADRLRCGRGDDRITVDRRDDAADCERPRGVTSP
jgi:Ca2+-binding RTX toxin-like protein